MNYVHWNWKNLNTDLDINKFKTIIDDNKINKKKKKLNENPSWNVFKDSIWYHK